MKTLLYYMNLGQERTAPKGDNPNLCVYVELQTWTLPSLTRLVLVVHGKDYEFRRNLFTGVVTGENLITRDTREWTLVK